MVDISCVQKDIGHQFQDEAIIKEALTAAGVAVSSDQNNPDTSKHGNKHRAMVGDTRIRLVTKISGISRIPPRYAAS